MKNIKNRFYNAISNEGGGPMMETICAIGVGLLILGGVLFAGFSLLQYIGTALSSVESLKKI